MVLSSVSRSPKNATFGKSLALNTPLFIARRIGGQKSEKNFVGLIRRIAIVSIALGLSVMIVSVAVVTGFQREIRDKVTGFGAHIQITHLDFNHSFEARPMQTDQAFLKDIMVLEGVDHVQAFATKPGLIKTEDEIHGVILKGVGPDFNWGFFSERLIHGSRFILREEQPSNEVVISRLISRRLQLEVGDDLFLYFIQDPPRIRRLTVSGIYDTQLEELDRLFVLGDIRHIQTLNDWTENQVGGFELLVSDFKRIPEIREDLYEVLPYHLDARSIRDLYPQIFDWLALLDMNVYVIIVLIVIVASINMITTLLILVLEKTVAVGSLKAMGATNTFMRKVFLYQAAILISQGLLWGNALSLSLLCIQKIWGFVQLSPESYYVSVVPVNISFTHIILLNAGAFSTSILMLILPTYVIAKISPSKTMAFK